MDTQQETPDLVENARLDAIEKYAEHLTAEVALARQDGGFFDRKYWDEFLVTQTQWQSASNTFYTMLHELSK